MSPQAAVILVAGIGARLRPLTDDRPKALLEIGEETILSRATRLLVQAGVREIVLATGYREEQVRKSVEHLRVRVTICPNPNYTSTQNSVSLGLCRSALRGKSFYKLDGDVVFQPEVLERLRAAGADLGVAIDAENVPDDEAMKARVLDGKIVSFGKGMAPENCVETIGIELLSAEAGERVFDAIARCIAAGRTDLYYEDVYSDLVERGVLEARPVDVTDLPWVEVDTLQDLDHARLLAATNPTLRGA